MAAASKHLAVGEDALIGRHIHHFAHKDTAFPAHHLAFEGKGILVDDRGVHIRARGNREACLCHLVGDLVAAHKAEVIGLGDGALIGKRDRESAGELQVLRRFVLGQGDDNLIVVILPGPGGHHHVGSAVLVPGGEHHAGLRGGHKGVGGAEVLAPGDFFQGFIRIHIRCVLVTGVFAADRGNQRGNGNN